MNNTQRKSALCIASLSICLMIGIPTTASAAEPKPLPTTFADLEAKQEPLGKKGKAKEEPVTPLVQPEPLPNYPKNIPTVEPKSDSEPFKPRFVPDGQPQARLGGEGILATESTATTTAGYRTWYCNYGLYTNSYNPPPGVGQTWSINRGRDGAALVLPEVS